MRKLLPLLIVGILLVISGCSSMPPAPEPIDIEPPETKLIPTSTQVGLVDIETKMMDDTWISPAKVEVGNFYPGARAEWYIRLHNGNDETIQIEKLKVGTEIGETDAYIPLKFPLAGRDITKASVTSDNKEESLVVYGYDAENRKLGISGFTPSSSRIITIVYKAWTEFNISYRYPNNTVEGYAKASPEAQSWVIIADTTPVLSPKETREILIALDMPADAMVADNQWEFWISVVEGGQGEVQTELCERWLVNMR